METMSEFNERLNAYGNPKSKQATNYFRNLGRKNQDFKEMKQFDEQIKNGEIDGIEWDEDMMNPEANA